MAHQKIQINDVYLLNKNSRGLGTNPKGLALYKIQSGGQSISSSLPSLANKGFTMAVGRIKDTEKKKNWKKKKKKNYLIYL